MSFLTDYDQRTAWKYAPIRGTFPTADSLADRILPDGGYTPFPGCAVAFRPGRQGARILQLMQLVLTQQLEPTGMLAAPLPAAALRLELRSLFTPEMDPGAGAETCRRQIADRLRGAVHLLDGLREAYAGRSVTLVADRIVNLLSQSLSLLLRPRTEQDAQLLLELSRPLDVLQPLPYPLTPQIPLAYFRPGMLDGDTLGAAVERAQIVPENAPVFQFDVESLTAQRGPDLSAWTDVPLRVCFCCDGGLNRSVMAAAIVRHLAEKRGLPVTAEARAAYPNTQGRPVPEAVGRTLAAHGIAPDSVPAAARYLEERETAWFSAFACISAGALDRAALLRLPEERTALATGFFLGVRDPEYGEVTHEEAFLDLYARAERYLEALALTEPGSV